MIVKTFQPSFNTDIDPYIPIITTTRLILEKCVAISLHTRRLTQMFLSMIKKSVTEFIDMNPVARMHFTNQSCKNI